MTTLRDALAAALTDSPVELWTDGRPWALTAAAARKLADRALADPAFREALVESVAEAEAMHPLDGCEWAEKYRSDARAIVERMLP